jgi:hypothetical protein
MDWLDREIMLGLLGSQRSIYTLEKSLKGSNYATVLRRIKRMEKHGLLKTVKVRRKDGRPDKRGTEKPELTAKGEATLIVEGDLQKEELVSVGRKVLEEGYGDFPANLLQGINVGEVFASTLLKMRHKINVKFFDETYFNRTFNISFAESLFDAMKNFDFGKLTEMRAQAEKLRKKYVGETVVETLSMLRQQLLEERDELNHYIEFITPFLKVVAQWT